MGGVKDGADSEQLSHYATNRPHVAGKLVLSLVQQKFRSDVARSPNNCLVLLFELAVGSATKISNFDFSLLVKKDVLGVEVHVSDPLLMQGLHA